ncbi:MAG: NADP-dependent malic enzyme [candidate division Zixibacteria bacterium]|nr:NADP-dependent malic enzyme [candidate division Zixibacteria bacterium]
MKKYDITLENLPELFPKDFTKDQIAKAQTVFLKELSRQAHQFYGGKMMTVPKAGLYGFNWFNVWYTPGVSVVSTSIRDNYDASFELTNRGNLVAVVSDSTRVLGDGDVTPPGGLGVMEGKAFLMKYLGGIDATAICIDSKNAKGENDADKMIEFVKMLQPSFGAINLEDISQPNCYKVLDTLREVCDIPVWHDDAQGTGCVTLAGLVNALKVVDKDISKVKIVMLGAGASNTTIARLILKAGADPNRMVIFDTKGTLHRKREDIRADTRFYRKWELCEQTNPDCIDNMETAVKGADVFIALSKSDPTTVKPAWIKAMAPKSIVFACANPEPEIYPHAAKAAGAAIVATGRGDFPNQVNNSLGFPGILKGALLVRARKVTDEMAIEAAYSIARAAEKNGLRPDYIVPTMEEDIYPTLAADVAMQAIKDGVARKEMGYDEIFARANKSIKEARSLINHLMQEDFIKKPPMDCIEKAVELAVAAVK